MFVACVVVVAVVLLLFLGTRKPRGFPPGPPRLPILGQLPFLGTYSLHKDMLRLSSTYGPVVGVYFGSQAAIFVNGWDAVKESLLNDDLNGRPVVLTNEIIYKGQKGVIFVEEQFWKEQRRFALHHFRNLGFGKRSHEAVVLEEVADLLQEIRETKGSLTLQNMLGVSNINILWAVMGGTRYGRQDPRLWELVDSLNKVFRAGEASGGLVQVFPFLRHVMPEHSRFNAVLKGFRLAKEFIEASVEEHKATLDPQNPRDFIDLYIKEMNEQKKDPNTTFSDMQMVALCTDIFSAGTETVSATVTFGILLTTLHSDIMTKIQQELDDVVGRSRLPSIEDRNKLVYTDATLNEIHRFRGAAPLTAPHKALKDTILQGHRIPAGTMVMNNLYSVHMDPHYWRDPETFRPERFISPDGSLKKEERLIIFGKGRRVCLGESLARMTSFLLFASLLQHFTFTLDPAIPVLNTEGKAGFTLAPPEHKVFAKPRF